MKNLIIKLFVIAIAGISLFWAASNKFKFPQLTEQTNIFTPKFDENGYWRTQNFLVKKNADDSVSYFGTKSLYGNYLAGRIAHMRQDFLTATEYYKLALEKDPENAKLNRIIYVILTSLGRIDDASIYAQKQIENEEKGGKKEMLAPLVIATQKFSAGEYAAAREIMLNADDTVYTKFILPFFGAWSYAGEYNEQQAITELNKLPLDPQLDVIKLFHAAMIYDYVGNKKAANECFSLIVQKYPKDVTYRLLEVITNFYVRTGNKDMAVQISGRYNDNGLLSLLIKDIDAKIEKTTQASPAIIDTPQKGLAEAFFNLGAIFRAAPNGLEIAQFYIAASSYLNPDYEISKIALANVLEEIGLLHEANKYYEQINKNSGSYFIARIKMIENYNSLKEFDAAKEQLQNLLKDYPENTQLLTDLGSIYANMKQDEDAVRAYNQALASAKDSQTETWPIYYAAAISYDRLNQKNKTEEFLLKAKELSNNNPNVLNYLGYSWLTQNKNVDEAVQMIYAAYQQSPYESHIIDSLGWIFFKLGNYPKAIEFLEYASSLSSGNAVISDHLGDAYWLGGRKNEAVFQWKHALVLREDSDSIDKEKIQQKINNGVENSLIWLKDKSLEDTLQNLSAQPQED